MKYPKIQPRPPNPAIYTRILINKPNKNASPANTRLIKASAKPIAAITPMPIPKPFMRPFDSHILSPFSSINSALAP